jgi:hypothetical protein
MTGRVIWAGLELLDRQMIDHDGVLCGNVDDLQLSEPTADGTVYVEAIVAGPGAVLERVGARRLGRWLQGSMAAMDSGLRALIPAELISDIGSSIRMAVNAEELATTATERWWREHLIEHIPGSLRADR